MARRLLFDQRMESHLRPTHYPSSVTIQGGAETLSSHHDPIVTWTDVANLVNLPCHIAPIATVIVRAERPEQQLTYLMVTHQIALAGHFPTITATMRAVVAGNVWDIVQVSHDGQGATTRLDVKSVTL